MSYNSACIELLRSLLFTRAEPARGRRWAVLYIYNGLQHPWLKRVKMSPAMLTLLTNAFTGLLGPAMPQTLSRRTMP